MELGLSLGDSQGGLTDAGKELVLSLGVGSGKRGEPTREREIEAEVVAPRSGEPPVHLSLLPLNFSWPSNNQNSKILFQEKFLPNLISKLWKIKRNKILTKKSNRSFNCYYAGNLEVSVRGFDVNRAPSAEEMEEDAALSSSPNSAVSSFQMDFSARRGAAATTSGGASAGNGELERKAADGSHSRASDEDETGSSRKKLRLSKEQSAFLEESFKEHNTLNPVCYLIYFFILFF